MKDGGECQRMNYQQKSVNGVRPHGKFKADSEAPSLHGHLHIGESAFERIYDNRFRLILQGVELYYQKMVKYAV